MKNSLPRPKRHLSVEAKAWWTRIVEGWELDDASLLLLESALEAFDRMREAQAILKKEGLVVQDRFGQKKTHPAALVERDAKGVLLRHVKSLGLDLEPIHDSSGRPPGR